MPILNSAPLESDYRKIAIVEAWGTLDHKDEMLDALRQKACSTGADALLIVSSQSQVDGRLETMDLPTSEVQNDEGNSNRSSSYEESLTPQNRTTRTPRLLPGRRRYHLSKPQREQSRTLIEGASHLGAKPCPERQTVWEF